MRTPDFIRRRRENQLLVRPLGGSPAAVVAWFGAVQAQDYGGALWAVGQRSGASVESDVELAIAERSIVRTWPMRGTLHFVAAEDVRWMLELLAPRIIQRHAARLLREYELDSTTLARCRKVLVEALGGDTPLTRKEIYHALEAAGIVCPGQRGIHILGRLAQEGLICFGPRRGRQPTFVLLDEWLPEGRGLLRDEALAELALRYFTGHGPATVSDLSWWSGLPLTDARAAVALVERRLVRERYAGRDYWCARPDRQFRRSSTPVAHLLPPFDEYLVGYRERTAVLPSRYAPRIKALLTPAVEVNGLIVGTWGRKLDKGKVRLHLTPFTRWNAATREAVAAAGRAYGEFLGVPSSLY